MVRQSVLLVLGTLILCSPRLVAAESPKQTLPKLGAIIGLTGNMAAWGDRCQKAYSLALEDLQCEHGSLPFELLIEDSPESLPKNTLTALSKLEAMDQVFALIGVFSPEEVDAVTPVLNDKQMGLVSFAPGTIGPGTARYLWPDPQYEAEAVATELRKQFSRVAVLSDQTAWTEKVAQSFVRRFQKLGGEVVAMQAPAISAASVRTEALRAKSAKPEAIFIPSYYLFSQYTKELSAIKNTVPLFGIELDESARQLSMPHAEGVIFIRPAASNEFDARFRSKFGVAADLPATYCYDQLRLAHQLFLQIPSERREQTKLRPAFAVALSQISSYRGVSGDLHFKPGRTESPLGWFRFSANQIEALGADFWQPHKPL